MEWAIGGETLPPLSIILLYVKYGKKNSTLSSLMMIHQNCCFAFSRNYPQVKNIPIEVGGGARSLLYSDFIILSANVLGFNKKTFSYRLDEIVRKFCHIFRF